MSGADPAPTPAATGLAGNIGWYGLAQGWNLLLAVLSGVILARLLLPADFAVMAFIAPLLALTQLLQGMGLVSATVQARTLSAQQLSNVFWLQFSVSLVLAVVLALGGPVLARALLGLELEREMAFIALSVIASALMMQPGALMMRQLRFRALALRNIAASTAGTLAGIGLALTWRSHWALLVPPVLIPFLHFAISARAIRWRPGRPRPRDGLGTMLGFGLRVWGANLMNLLSQHADNLIVAAAATPTQLGLYDRSYRVLAYPLTQAVGPLGQVLVPTLTRRAEAGAAGYAPAYWQAVGLLLLLCLPGLAVAAAYPVTLIGILLGPNWLEAAPLFGWFALAAMAETLIAALGWLLHSQGRAAAILRSGLVTTAIALAAFLIGIRWGILGVATAFALGRIALCLPFQLWLVGKEGPVGHRDLAAALRPHAVALALSAGLVAALKAGVGGASWPLLILNLIAAYAAYALALLAQRASRPIVLGALARARSVLG